MIKVKVLFFAASQDLAGCKESELELSENITIGEFRKVLVGKYTRLKKMESSFSIALNSTYTRGDEKLTDGCEVAIIPPVSGGKGRSI
jgi:molybdopterin converting factor subunit 1